MGVSHHRTNDAHQRASAIFDVLQRRGSERLLVPLFSHHEPVVRGWAATHLAKSEPQEALAILKAVSSGDDLVSLTFRFAYENAQTASGKD